MGVKRTAPAALAVRLLAIALLTISGLGIGTPQEGELVFSTESIDLGRIPFDQPASFRFEMRNTGGKPVTIARPVITAIEGC